VNDLAAACLEGNSSILGTGINPGFMMERLGVTLTGLCNRIRCLTLREFVDCSRVHSQDVLRALGFGGPPNDECTAAGRLIARRYYESALQLTSRALFGRLLERIDHDVDCTLASRDLHTETMTIARGTVCAMVHRLAGFIEDAPRLVIEEHWHQGATGTGALAEASGDRYVFELEAEPCSLNVEMSYSSVESDGTPASTYITAVPMIQAIERVCEAPPGIVLPRVWGHSTTVCRFAAA
jgi:hypothetical protein